MCIEHISSINLSQTSYDSIWQDKTLLTSAKKEPCVILSHTHFEGGCGRDLCILHVKRLYENSSADNLCLQLDSNLCFNIEQPWLRKLNL